MWASLEYADIVALADNRLEYMATLMPEGEAEAEADRTVDATEADWQHVVGVAGPWEWFSFEEIRLVPGAAGLTAEKAKSKID